jgi:glycerophosphoryl diester phosphodiesterase
MKRSVLIVFTFCILLFSCAKDDYDIENLYNKIFILGHGGMGVGKAQYPLDSYEGIQKALSLGADGSEIDIQLTNDSVLVCFHDHYLEDATLETGEIYSKSWDEIKNSVYKGDPYATYKIFSLDWMFSVTNDTIHKFTFDIKFTNPDQSAANRDIFQRALIRLIEKYHLSKNVTIESPSVDFLTAFKQKKPGYNLFIYTDFDSALQTAKDLGLKGITVKADEVTADQVSEAHKAGIMIAVFSTTHRNHEEVIKKNVDIIQTDDLEDLLVRLK